MVNWRVADRGELSGVYLRAAACEVELPRLWLWLEKGSQETEDLGPEL